MEHNSNKIDIHKREFMESCKRFDESAINFAKAVFNNIIKPTLVEWKIYISWGMGSVGFYEGYGDSGIYYYNSGNEIGDYRLKPMLENVAKVCEESGFYDRFKNTNLYTLLSIMSTRGITDYKGDILSHGESYYSDIPKPIRDKPRTFSELAKGEPFYYADLEHGDICRLIVSGLTIEKDKRVRVLTIPDVDFDQNHVDRYSFDPDGISNDNYFTDWNMANKYLYDNFK